MWGNMRESWGKFKKNTIKWSKNLRGTWGKFSFLSSESNFQNKREFKENLREIRGTE